MLFCTFLREEDYYFLFWPVGNFFVLSTIFIQTIITISIQKNILIDYIILKKNQLGCNPQYKRRLHAQPCRCAAKALCPDYNAQPK